MEVETKFDIGDKVWLIYNNIVTALKVCGYRITIDESFNPEIVYTLHYNCLEVAESQLFKTKEELLNSL